MSYIQFESARDKEKARQDLKEAREYMLEEAKRRAEQRADRDAKKLLKGETNWMLPSVKEKLLKKSKEHKRSKDKKTSQKSKKKFNRKRIHSTSENDSKIDFTSDDTEKSVSRKCKSSKKSKKKKSHKKRKYLSSDDESETSDTDSNSDTDDTDSSEDNVQKRSRKKIKSIKHKKYNLTERNDSWKVCDKNQDLTNMQKPKAALKRDSWMTDALMLKTYSKERVENKVKDNQQIDAYDPAISSRELNPYWKKTGTGLPSFQKPKDEGEDKCSKTGSSFLCQKSIGTKGWKKRDGRVQPQKSKSRTSSEDEASNSEGDFDEVVSEKSSTTASEFLTDQQMNELGAKILKAEIMGNMELAGQLQKKLEKARTQRNIFKERKKLEYINGKQHSLYKSKAEKCHQEEHVLLTHTDKVGNTRPLPASKLVGLKEKNSGKKKQQRATTHNDSGQRILYFADDDRYDIKQMFEKEKYTSVSEANLQFANMAGKNKNPNDDLEDIFAEKISRDDSLRGEHKEQQKAIREHQKIEKTLDNCDRCFDSTKMQKELLICVGEKAYISLPWYQGLQQGHCMIVPTQHATCCTQIDEDTWSEINDFRKSLTHMFASQHKDVIFFEIANKLHKQPHLAIHCIPIKESDGEMAPFYFKKAIEESEYEWCVNKQLISLRNKSLRNAIPKGLPYFWVNFGMDSGFAHVIEDEERFPVNYAQEIIGGMINLDPKKWRSMQKEQNIISKVKMFAEWWKKYDFTK